MQKRGVHAWPRRLPQLPTGEQNARPTFAGVGETARPWFPGGERVAGFVGLLAALYAAWLTVRPVVGALVLAAAIASLSYPMYRGLGRILRRRRVAAAASVLVLFAGVLGPLALA